MFDAFVIAPLAGNRACCVFRHLFELRLLASDALEFGVLTAQTGESSMPGLGQAAWVELNAARILRATGNAVVDESIKSAYRASLTDQVCTPRQEFPFFAVKSVTDNSPGCSLAPAIPD